MGSTFDASLVTWSDGRYSGATRRQDDLAIMAGLIPSKRDSVGNTRNSGEQIRSSSNRLQNIEAGLDQDAYRFSAKAGENIRINVTPTGNYPMLNSAVFLYNSSGRLIAQNDRAPSGEAIARNALRSALSYRSPNNAEYYVIVRGNAYNGGTNFNHSRYGMIGNYNLSITGISPDGVISIIPVINFLLNDDDEEPQL